jgi:hypothetical protein
MGFPVVDSHQLPTGALMLQLHYSALFAAIKSDVSFKRSRSEAGRDLSIEPSFYSRLLHLDVSWDFPWRNLLESELASHQIFFE